MKDPNRFEQDFQKFEEDDIDFDETLKELEDLEERRKQGQRERQELSEKDKKGIEKLKANIRERIDKCDNPEERARLEDKYKEHFSLE